MKNNFRQFNVTKVVSNITVFLILMLLGIESLATSVTEEKVIEVVPGLLHINFKKRLDKTKVDDAIIDHFLAQYGFIYHPNKCNGCTILPRKYKSASKRSRWRKISVDPGTEKAWIQFFQKTRLVKNVRQEQNEITRSSTKTRIDLTKRAKKQAPSFTTTFWTENFFKEVEGFLKKQYGCVMKHEFSNKNMCGFAKKGNCCIEVASTFPRSQVFSITYLYSKVIKHKKLFESLKISLMIDEKTSQFQTMIIRGKYAHKRYKGHLNPVVLKDIETDYYQALDNFVESFAEELKRHIEEGNTK